MSKRPENTTAEIEEAENAWWNNFSEVENRFCWVQTTQIQRELRGHYLRKIIKYAGKNGNILELGCGTGWLCLLLAKLGANSVTGIDFSSKQIATAKNYSSRLRLSDKARFECVDGTSYNSEEKKYDVVIVHGFLHHLNNSEIRRTLRGILDLMTPNGVFIAFEPMLLSAQNNDTKNPWEEKLQWLQRLANRGVNIGLRKFTDTEKEWRSIINSRATGIPPHGPSPKEIPFDEGELESLLDIDFKIEESCRCMAMSHLVVQEWLLRQISHPISSLLLIPIIAKLAGWMERKALNDTNALRDVWSFNMFVSRRK